MDPELVQQLEQAASRMGCAPVGGGAGQMARQSGASRFVGIKCYAIIMLALPSSMVWKSFDEAVEASLEDMDY